MILIFFLQIHETFQISPLFLPLTLVMNFKSGPDQLRPEKLKTHQ